MQKTKALPKKGSGDEVQKTMSSFEKIRILLVFAVCGFLMTGCENSSDSSDSSAGFGDNDRNVILALGDSITAGSEIRGPAFPQIVADMSGKAVINAGVGGELSIDGLNEISELLTQIKPGYVFILYGVNDLIHVGNYDWTIENLRQMIWIAKENKTHPIVGTITPRFGGNGSINAGHQELNRRIRILCTEEKIRLADVELEFDDDVTLMQADGMHPTEDGNVIIAAVFYEAMR